MKYKLSIFLNYEIVTMCFCIEITSLYLYVSGDFQNSFVINKLRISDSTKRCKQFRVFHSDVEIWKFGNKLACKKQ